MNSTSSPSSNSPEGKDRAAYLADGMEPTPRNLAAATKALAVIAAAGWEALAGYPGSDEPWRLRCLLCGWEGDRFYSHLRRGRPKYRHADCLAPEEQAVRLAALSKPTVCRCVFAHPTTPEKVREVRDGIAYARQIGDDSGLLIRLAQLLGPCPAAGARADALRRLNEAEARSPR